MCNLSMGVLNKGKMEQAKETAYELRDMGLPDEKVARAVKVGMDTLQEWFAEREAIFPAGLIHLHLIINGLEKKIAAPVENPLIIIQLPVCMKGDQHGSGLFFFFCVFRFPLSLQPLPMQGCRPLSGHAQPEAVPEFPACGRLWKKWLRLLLHKICKYKRIPRFWISICEDSWMISSIPLLYYKITYINHRNLT